MSLTFYFHPLSSYCHKALIALYENETPFKPRIVDLGDPADRAVFAKVWPLCKFPVVRDDAKARTVPESSIIIEYLAQHYPGRTSLIPADPELALQTRLTDRFYDLHVHTHMQKIIGDRLRPANAKDPHGVEDAQTRLRTAYDMIEKDMAGKTWSVGETFSMADCSASPALFYANMVVPFVETHPNIAAYFERLKARPSYARVLKETEPYFNLLPR